MTKTAVLLTGEYRTFNFCRKTQLFLDHTDVDLYFHTWDKTNTLNPHRANAEGWEDYKPVYRDITEEEVKSVIGKDCVIKINPYPAGTKNPMIQGWINGLDLVKQSSIEYDYMLVLRPDLFFGPKAVFNTVFFPLYENHLGVRPPPLENPTALDDTCFFSSYKNIKKLITTDLFNFKWLGHHQWFKYVVIDKKLKLCNLPIGNQNNIARHPINDDTSWGEVQATWRKWFENGK